MPYNWQRKISGCQDGATRAGGIGRNEKDYQMNGDISENSRGRQSPSRFRRAGVLAAAAAFGLLAACGGSSSSTAGLPGLQQELQEALAYSQCMRSHGIANFPDPTQASSGARNTNGEVQRGVGIAIQDGTIDASSPQYLSANRTCTKLTGFGHVPAAQLRQGLITLLRYSECMRSHGIANFPDPVENSNGVSIKTAGTGIDVYSPRYKAADRACRALEPGGGQ